MAVPVDEQGRLAGEIAVATRGVIDEGAEGDLLESARKQARAAPRGAARVGGIDRRSRATTRESPKRRDSPFAGRWRARSASSQ